MAFKRPFGKVRKIEKKQQAEEPVQKVQQKPENQSPQNEIVSKTPLFSLGSKKGKLGGNSKNIYEAALKKNQNNEQAENTEQRQSVSLRPDFLKKKTGRKLGVGDEEKPLIQMPIHEEDSTSLDAPKPTPLFHGRKNNLGLRQKIREKEKVLIEQQQETSRRQFQEESYNEQQQSVHKRPDMKIKKKLEKTPREKAIIEVDEEKIVRRDDYADQAYVDIQPTKINFEKQEIEVSQAKIQKQQQRTKDLKQLLNLESDLYEQLISLSCMTQYQVYINKIKNDSLRNSIDQAFDEKSTVHTQTLSFEFVDFYNQCPQDYLININAIVQTDQSDNLNSFILKIAPVIEELIMPSAEVMMPPIFLLALRPEFHLFTKCPYPIFIYSTQQYGIAVIGEKLYIAEGKISSALIIGSYLVGGLQNGKIAVWTGKNDRNSRLYRQVYEAMQSTNFELPSVTNEELDRYSLYRSYGNIVSLIGANQNEFISLDEYGKLIHWCLQEKQGQGIFLKGVKQFDFGNALQKSCLVAYSMKNRKDKFFIQTSAGILVWNGEQVVQKLETKNCEVINFELPKRSSWVYVICSDNSLRIFDQNYSKEAFSMHINSNSKLANIILPEIVYFNQQISIWSHFYVTNVHGTAYEINLLESTNEEVMSIESKQTGRDVIFQGVNTFGNCLQIITLLRDLTCKKEIKRMNIDLEANKQNLKSVSQGNRYVGELLTDDSVIF